MLKHLCGSFYAVAFALPMHCQRNVMVMQTHKGSHHFSHKTKTYVGQTNREAEITDQSKFKLGGLAVKFTLRRDGCQQGGGCEVGDEVDSSGARQ